MFVKKSAGKVLGIRFNSAERKAMDMEIRKQTAEYDRKNAIEIDALVLWVLHKRFGFGPERMKRFHDEFKIELQELLKRYEMEDCDQVWLCTHMLDDYLSDHDIKLADWWKEDDDNS